jgi:hypothetical protein
MPKVMSKPIPERIREALEAAGAVVSTFLPGAVSSSEKPTGLGLVTEADSWIRREFHCFPSKVADNPPFVTKMLQQSIDFHKRSFNPPGVLIYEPGAISPAPTLG